MVLLHSIYYVRKYCFQTANAEEEPSAATERKRSRETFHQAQLQLFRRLTAAQFIRLVTSGFVNISLHAKLIPLFHENVKLPSGLHTRRMISLNPSSSRSFLQPNGPRYIKTHVWSTVNMQVLRNWLLNWDSRLQRSDPTTLSEPTRVIATTDL